MEPGVLLPCSQEPAAGPALSHIRVKQSTSSNPTPVRFILVLSAIEDV
jgi:hypothetical protein